MPWYYAGPEAKPVGPVSLEELHARRVSGVISPETYVIEHTGQPSENWAWKHYREIFPSSPTLPPVPSVPPVFPGPATPPPQPAVQPHPLFPSAAPVGHSPFPAAARPDPYYKEKRTNGWCAWGFGLGLASFILLLPTCGLAVLLALPALIVCIVGMIQVNQHRDQAGQGMAIAGLILSGLALILSLVLLAWALPAVIKKYEFSITEQTTNDTE